MIDNILNFRFKLKIKVVSEKVHSMANVFLLESKSSLHSLLVTSIQHIQLDLLTKHRHWSDVVVE